MIRTILWKEWREHRSRYVSYWLTLNAPLLILCLAIAFSTTARAPFADLSDVTVWKYLPLSLIESVLLPTVFMLAAGYLAVATFSREIEDRSLFFLFEQPVPRKQYAAIKLLNGGVHVVAATCLAAMLMPTTVYGMMLLSGKVTVAGSGAALAAVLSASMRGALWGLLLALVGFTASAAISALTQRWWIAAVSSVVMIALFAYYSGDFFFDFFPPDPREPISVSANITTGNAPWVAITRALTPAELATFGQLKALPLFTAAVLIAVFSAGVALLYDRKELK